MGLPVWGLRHHMYSLTVNLEPDQRGKEGKHSKRPDEDEETAPEQYARKAVRTSDAGRDRLQPKQVEREMLRTFVQACPGADSW